MCKKEGCTGNCETCPTCNGSGTVPGEEAILPCRCGKEPAFGMDVYYGIQYIHCKKCGNNLSFNGTRGEIVHHWNKVMK